MNTAKKIACPTCGKYQAWSTANTFRPFCSERCKLIDLGEWANETRRIAGHSMAPDLSLPIDNEPSDSN
ncbi:DNA gyrase inhibitor YacG [Legionella busanensis]|uniref:DNA gyrase inhibitor YacG n=1 Tax=Legionella busanensis TaxID=190655 RepID=A0A378JJV9_9GAMM|nr:DNA gyrase inhibitor YacG [Legionella busanensis]STX51464.1 DNA gyrase inhibitor YacG [Legionella busanensis]